MNIDEALHKHAEWKTKFRSAIMKNETMDVATIEKDNCCDFGKWLYGDALKRYGSLEPYKVCVAKHANFHREAGKVASLINAKKYQEAETALAMQSEYGKATNEVGVAIVRLRKEIGL